MHVLCIDFVVVFFFAEMFLVAAEVCIYVLQFLDSAEY